MVRYKKRKYKNKLSTILLAALAVILILAIGFQTIGLTLVSEGDTVWIPEKGRVRCTETRLECYPGQCSDTNPEFKELPNDRDTLLFCGAPTISDANYYKGCEIYLRAKGIEWGDWFRATSIAICDDSGCGSAENSLTESALGASTRMVKLQAGQHLRINPNLATYEYHIEAPVYGLEIVGSGINVLTDRCNLASALNQGQIATLKNSPDYEKTVLAGEINPGTFGVEFITDYRASYRNQRIITKDGDSWFIQEIGLRCKIAEDTNSRLVVTNECKNDNSIECFPNIGNCDSTGKLRSENDPSYKSCVPGTLIGSTTQRIPVSDTKACFQVCDQAGNVKNSNCIEIPQCSDGKILNPNYECVDSTKLDAQEICEAKGGKYSETINSKGEIDSKCDYSGSDTFIMWLLIGALAVIIVMLLVKIKMDNS